MINSAPAAVTSLDELPAVMTEQFVADMIGVKVERFRKWWYEYLVW